jgi:hypothetical protein
MMTIIISAYPGEVATGSPAKDMRQIPERVIT